MSDFSTIEAPAITLSTSLGTTCGSLTLDVFADGRRVIEGINLGVTINGVDLGSEVTLVRSETRVESGAYTAVSGKAAGKHAYTHRETVHHLVHASGIEWQLHVREARDGIAFRYAAADLWGHARFTSDNTVIPLDGVDRAWVLDYQTWYETPRYAIDLPGGRCESGLPVLFRPGPGREPLHLFVTESAIDGRFAGAHLLIESSRAAFVLADADVEVTRGPITPWRVLMLGDLPTIVESRLVDELAPPASPCMAEATWVRPGRAAWSWWSDFYSGAQIAQQRRFVDAAVKLGWEHLLIDCGWDAVWVPEIVAYASERDVQVHLWAVWHDLDGPEGLAKLALWRSWGVAGIKVDFMESESKDRYRWYDTILAESARLGLMVNFHGSVIPRGWARTWPQVIGYEAVRGSEYYVFYQDTPLTAAHNVVLPFTRNVVGAMDYTPGAFSAPDRQTSTAHELALGIVYECGITNFADDVDAYLSRPAATRLLTEMPATWDETRLLAGDPDTHAVLARRSGDRWFIGAIATGAARRLTIPLARLGDHQWDAWIVTDGPDGELTTHEIVLGDEIAVEIAEHGGFCAVLAPRGTDLFRAAPREIQPAVVIEPAVQMLTERGTAEIHTEPDAHLRLPAGWRARNLSDGRWEVYAPTMTPPGAVTIITIERPGTDVPVTAPARIVTPFAHGATDLAAAPIIAVENESGPVERNQSNGAGNPGDGKRMTVAGAQYDKGLGVSTPSIVTLFLGGQVARFSTLVGIDDETPNTRAVAEVIADGNTLARTDLTAGSPALSLDLDVTSVERLTLAVHPVAADDEPAHVDWLTARVHR